MALPIGLERHESGYRESDPGTHLGKVMRYHYATSAWEPARGIEPRPPPYQGGMLPLPPSRRELAAQGSNLESSGVKSRRVCQFPHRPSRAAYPCRRGCLRGTGSALCQVS